jgi:hypothetical protein
LLVILSPRGAIERAWTWGSPDYREAVRGILPLADGGLLVGQRESYMGDTHGFVLRVDGEGDITWARDVDSCTDDEPVLSTAILTDEGNFIVGGHHYATETKALLFRMAPDGSGDEPAWATETTIEPILGLQPRSIHQLRTGELRVVGLWGRTGGRDEVFAAGTDSIGRFSWLRWYGGDRPQGPPTSRITSQGGLMIAAASATVEEAPGGLWLFEVPTPNGAIDFDPATDAMTESLDFVSSEACLVTPEASTAVSALDIALSSIEVVAVAQTPAVQSQ